MLRNIIYRDNDVEIVMSAHKYSTTSHVGVRVLSGPMIGSRTLMGQVSCDFSTAMTSVLLPCALVLCWTVVREKGSITEEIQRSVNDAIRKYLAGDTVKPREIDWTKQVPTEMDSVRSITKSR